MHSQVVFLSSWSTWNPSIHSLANAGHSSTDSAILCLCDASPVRVILQVAVTLPDRVLGSFVAHAPGNPGAQTELCFGTCIGPLPPPVSLIEVFTFSPMVKLLLPRCHCGSSLLQHTPDAPVAASPVVLCESVLHLHGLHGLLLLNVPRSL